MLQNQVDRLQRQLDQWQQLSDRLSRARLILFVLAALASGFTFITWGAVPWLLVSLVAFIPFLLMVAGHRRVDTAVSRLKTWLIIKQTHLARLNLDWANLPPPLPLPERLNHPYALDLDLLGPRSLHQLLDTAVSQEGSERLRDWLLDERFDLEVIKQRQARVLELTAATRFRDRLLLQAALVSQSDRFSGQAMAAWLAETTDPKSLRPLLLALSGLAGLNIILFLGSVSGVLPNIWLVPWLIYVIVYALLGQKGTETLFRDVLFLQDSLETLHGVFGFLERARYGRLPAVRELCQPFLDEAERPSQHMRRARRVAAGVGLQQNPFLGLMINAIVPWNLFIGYQMALRRQELAARVPAWLDVWYECEALSSLATFSWLNPDTTSLPRFETSRPSIFKTEAIGHPLVPAQSRVNNDFAVDTLGTVAIITGSNMAGKSTFLRTLGVNLVLAYAGGTVLARSLQTSPFRLFASIRVADSLTDGYSFFYAEVRRLETLLQALNKARERPLFFLIDEIFRGTNNRERLIGSRSYIRALVDGLGAGLIATHDLELVNLAAENEKIQNFHFRDDVADGRMVFDYKLHQGPCPTTNALKIMRLAGLPVDET